MKDESRGGQWPEAGSTTNDCALFARALLYATPSRPVLRTGAPERRSLLMNYAADGRDGCKAPSACRRDRLPLGRHMSVLVVV